MIEKKNKENKKNELIIILLIIGYILVLDYSYGGLNFTRGLGSGLRFAI